MKTQTLKIPKLNINRLNEQSTHFQTSRTRLNSEGLGYTFRACKEKISKSYNQRDDYIYELNNTLKINYEMISIMLKTQNIPNLSEKMIKIKELQSRREKLNKNKRDLRMKILINSQIKEEAKRRKEENISAYVDKIECLNENGKKKNITYKRNQKKFDEVEIYVNKKCDKLYKWKKNFNDFEILPFIYDNESFLYQKRELYSMIKSLNVEIEIVLRENVALKQRENYIEDNNSTSSHNKYSDIVKSYTVKNKYLTSYKNSLFDMFNILTAKVQVSNVKNNIMKCIDSNNSNNRSLISDIAIDSSMCKNPNNVWDISCIEHTDDNN